MHGCAICLLEGNNEVSSCLLGIKQGVFIPILLQLKKVDRIVGSFYSLISLLSSRGELGVSEAGDWEA